MGDVTINGAGANSTIIQAGTLGYPNGGANGIDRVFHIPSTYIVKITGVTIANGRTTGAGGGIYKSSPGTLTVENSVFSGNSATDQYGGGGIYNGNDTLNVIKSSLLSNYGTNGGGISNYKTLNVTNSTFSNNVAGTGGGGIDNFGAPTTVIIRNSTFSGNAAPANSGGGIYNEFNGILTMYNTLLANNSGGDCYKESGTVSGTHNLIETDGAGGSACGTTSPINGSDPQLSGLGNNGGLTQTFAIPVTSPAHNAGDNTICAAAPVSNQDQRGVARPQDTTCDIGAYEGVYALTVNTTTGENDHFCNDGDCAIHDAIENIGPGGTIGLDNALAGATIHLGSVLTIDKNMTIDGSNLASSVILSGDTDNNGTGDVQVFDVTNAVTNATLKTLTITKGAATNGAGIHNQGALTILASTISNNTSSSYGAGILSEDGTTLNIANSAFSGNVAGTYGGAIHSGATLTVKNSTFSGNSNAILNGGAGTLNLYNTILANSTGTDCENYGTIGTEQNNLIENSGSACGFVNGTNGDIIGSDPNLSSLANNGGVTETFALLAGSPAIDAGDNATCAASPVSNKDQRGATRPLDGDGNSVAVCDIGSYEAPQGSPSTPTNTPTGTATQTDTPTQTNTPGGPTLTPTHTPTFTVTVPGQTATATATTSCLAKPAKPTLLKPANNATFTNSKVKLMWSAANCTLGYTVTVKNVATGHTAFKKTVTGTKTKTTPLVPATYQWFVKACNAFGCSKSRKFKFTN